MEEIKNVNCSLEDLSDSGSIEVVGSHIYFYTEVKQESILTLNRTLKALSNKFKIQSIENDCEPAAIKLHINSLGGGLYSGLAALDAIKNCGVEVHTIIEGCSASAATLMSVVGNKRFITQNGFMLIHQMSTGFWGTYEDVKDEMENIHKFMDRIINIYVEHTNLPKKQLQQMLKKDLWFDSKECLKYGLVDEIL